MNARWFYGPALFLAAITLAPAQGVDEPSFPPTGFPGDRYAPLWTKSPFAIATPDAPAVSADYALVGLAQFDGVSYASLIDKQSQEHFVLTSAKPVRNLSLISIMHRADDATATIRHNGEVLTLRLENTTAASGPTASAGNPPNNGAPADNMISNVGGMVQQADMRPPVRFHRRPISVPPRPQ